VNESTFSTEPYLITIGNHVSMTYPRFITHDGAVWVFRDEYRDIELFGPIVVGNNVFIGYGATILPGAVVGDNSIVAAGALVKGAFPAGVVIGGVPAKVICSTQEYFDKNKDRFTHFRRAGIHGMRERVLTALQEQASRQSDQPDLTRGRSS
jgi:acetyltransferase-like isoleucine patch superfamily enzyme